MQEKLKELAVVSLIRNCKSKNDYYIRVDNSTDKINSVIVRLRDQFDYDIELGTQIVIEKETDNGFYNSAKQEAEMFINYLKNVVSTNYKEDNFLGGWFELKDITNTNKWLTDFYIYQGQRESIKSNNTSRQITLF